MMACLCGIFPWLDKKIHKNVSLFFNRSEHSTLRGCVFIVIYNLQELFLFDSVHVFRRRLDRVGAQHQNLVVFLFTEVTKNFSSMSLVCLDLDSEAICHQTKLNTTVFSSYRCFSVQLAHSPVNSPQMLTLIQMLSFSVGSRCWL